MTENANKQAAAPTDNQNEQECCELYGEYCYPCAGEQAQQEAPKSS